MKGKDIKKTKIREQKISKLVKKIKLDLSQLKTLEKSSTELKLKIASRFVKLQVLVRAAGYTWENFVTKNFKNQSYKSFQRHMKIVKNIDLDETPKLAAVGLTRLGKLAKIAKKKSIKKALEKYDASLDSEDMSPKLVLKVKSSIDELFKKEEVPKKNRHSGRFIEIDKICKDIAKICERIQNIKTNSKVRHYVTYSHGINTYFDARDIYDKIEDWFRLFMIDSKIGSDLKSQLLM
jgi:hypothetical protein